MKKAMLVFLLAVYSISTIAQSACDGKHKIFNVPKDKTPVVVTKLGASPQFTSLQFILDKNVYYKNLKALDNDPKHKAEINSLLCALGYTGVNDPKFTIDKLEYTTIPFGAIGMLGDGSHHYIYSILAITNVQNIPCWKINSGSDCNVYIMLGCGNAFYYCNAAPKPKPCPECGVANLTIKVIARYEEQDVYECNDCENTTIVKEIDERAILAKENIANIPLMPKGSAYPVKKIYIDIDKATFKRIKNYDINHKYCKHQCDDECGNECSSECEKEGCEASCEKK
ncbi:MAG: hypothetical protein JST82_00765 [Bacteroidetes bacterium]|nr:hypothetical protein [Bacteroidota bacterium]